MLRQFSLLMLLAVAILATGCAIGKVPDDWAYSAYGGAWQRDDPVRGRVGSILEPAGLQQVVSDSDVGGEPSPAEQDAMSIEPLPGAEDLPAPGESYPLPEPRELGPENGPPAPPTGPQRNPDDGFAPAPAVDLLEPSL